MLDRAATLLQQGDYEGARAIFQSFLESYEEATMEEGIAFCLERIGYSFVQEGVLDLGEQHLRSAQELYERHGDLQGLAAVRGSLGDLALARGDRDDARYHYRGAVLLSSRVGDPLRRAGSLVDLAQVERLYGMRRIEECEEGFSIAIGIYRAEDDYKAAAQTMILLANVLSEVGREEDSELRYRAAHTIFREIEDAAGVAHAQIGLAGFDAARGDKEMARERLSAAAMLAADAGDGDGQVAATCSLAHLYAEDGEADRAIALYEGALRTAREIGYVEGEALSAIRLGTLLLFETSEDARAGEVLECGLQAARRCQDDVQTAEALLYLGQLQARSDPDMGGDQIAESARILRRLGWADKAALVEGVLEKLRVE